MKNITATTFLFLVGLAIAGSVHALEIRTALDGAAVDEFDYLTVRLYTASEEPVPLLTLEVAAGDWWLDLESSTPVLRLSLEDSMLPVDREDLWVDFTQGKELIGEPALLESITLGVTFAFGNTLNMDGNPITNVADPVGLQDVVTKNFVLTASIDPDQLIGDVSDDNLVDAAIIGSHSHSATDVSSLMGAVYSGLIRNLPTFATFTYGSAIGISEATNILSDIETLSSHNSCTAQKLAVRLTTAPGTGASRSFFVATEGVAHPVTCTINDTSTSCHSGTTTSTIANNKAL